MKTSNKVKKIGIYVASLLGAAGTALQNYMAVMTLFQAIAQGASKATWAALHGIAIALGGACTGLVNLCINIGLLESFLERVTNKKIPDLKGWQRFRYWFGSSIFVVTGILFGLTALAFGPIGALAAIGIAAGFFVSVIMVIQELETWLESFDNLGPKKSLKQIFIEWKNSLTKGKVLGIVIAIGNVVALSLLFTLGLATFLTGVGVPALPALIIGLCVAFTGGAFTEFYFYNRFLSTFCEKIKEKWHAFKETTFPVFGAAAGIINAIVNGVLSYTGIMMITGLLTAASIAVPPLGVMIAIAATAAVFAATASFILGADFWISNSKKIIGYFKKEKEIPLLADDQLSLSSTASLKKNHGINITPPSDIPAVVKAKKDSVYINQTPRTSSASTLRNRLT